MLFLLTTNGIFIVLKRILQAGEYEELSEEIKEHLNDIGFKLEKLLEDEEYFL